MTKGANIRSEKTSILFCNLVPELLLSKIPILENKILCLKTKCPEFQIYLRTKGGISSVGQSMKESIRLLSPDRLR